MEETTFELRRRTRWYTYVGDFLNTLKAFIGTNYQALPFAFANSGVAVGLAGVFLVATLTDHGCQLLIRSKTYIIEKTIRHELESGKIGAAEAVLLRERLELAIGYGDIAKRVYGGWCFHLTQAAVCFTQFLVCLGYFVFIANTVAQIYPLEQVPICANNTVVSRPMTSRVRAEFRGMGVPMLNVPSIAYNFSARNRHRRSVISCNVSCDNSSVLAGIFQPHIDLNQNPMLLGDEGKRFERRQSLGDKMNFDLLSDNGTVPCNITEITTAPDLRLIVLFPLPIFILTSLIRNVRYLAPFSSIATVALAIGAVSVLVFLIKGFHLEPFEWYKIETLPLFLCQMISSYEGIGCILPIQSSMVGCRHLFPCYLHANIYIIYVILCAFGTLGYLSFGEKVQQIIVLEIPQHMLISILVDITLIISVVFTYPIQCYPVIEIMEGALLTPSNCCRRNAVQDVEEESSDGPKDDLLVQRQSLDMSVSELTNMTLPSTVPNWKRNILRVILTLIIAGLGVILRDYFAYLAAFSGALGASFLAFILPCMIDIRLRYNEMSRLVLIKNSCIIVFTVIVSVVGLAVTIKKVAEGLGPS